MPTVKAKADGVLFDPARTIQKIHWDARQIIWVAKFVGSGGAAIAPANVPTMFGYFSGIEPNYINFSFVGRDDDAKQFFKDHKDYRDEGPTEEAAAYIATYPVAGGSTWWYFAATRGNGSEFEHVIDTSAVFPTGDGALLTTLRIFLTPPPDQVITDPDTGAGYFRFRDLEELTADAEDSRTSTLADGINKVRATIRGENGSAIDPVIEFE